jgi:oligosaccharyltransferase complex subunit alpha (ribophorin I)
MKTLAVLSAVLSLAVSVASAGKQQVALESTFKPSAVFKNANLVHVISVEKNFVKESINVVVENIDKAAQDEYYLPFTSDQISRLGGFEVKDRNKAELGPFVAEVVEVSGAR